MAKRKKSPVPPKEPKLSEQDEAMLVCSMWKNRIKKAEDQQREWLNTGREIKRFIEGNQWNPDDDMGTPDNDWMRTTNNRMWPLYQGYLSNLIYQRPNVTAKAVRSGDEALQRAKVNSLLMNYVLRESRYAEHTRLAVSDALIYGCGAKEQVVDRYRDDISVSRWVSIEDIVVDPHANTTIDSVSWVAKRFTMRLSTARRIYKEAIKKAGVPLTPEKAGEGKEEGGHTSTGTSEQVGSAESSDEMVTLYRIYLRGDDPSVDDSDSQDKDNETDLEPEKDLPKEKSVLQKHLEKSGNRIITLCKGFPVILDERPWPYVLDHDEFPITFFRAHTYPGKFLPHSPLKPILPLQKNLNWAMTFLITQMRTMSQIKFAVDQSQFQGNEEEIEKLISLDDREVIRSNGRIKDAFERIDFGGLSSAPVQMFPFMESAFDDISGFQELFGGMRGARSATEASIREERAQTNSALMLQSIEMAMTEDIRHMLQIMFSVTSMDKVMEIVGKEELLVYEDPIIRNPIAAYWDPEMEPKKIRSEVDILLEPGSTRRVNREQEVADRINIMDRKVNLLGTVSQLLAGGLISSQEGLASILDFINKDLEDIADKMGWSETGRAKLPPEAFNLLPPPENTNQSFTIKEGDVTIQEGDTTIDEPNPSLSIDQPNFDLPNFDLSQTTNSRSGGE